MKSIRIIVAGCGIASALLLINGCTKDLHQKLPESSDFSNNVRVQLYNGVVGSNRNYLYVEGKQVNGTTIGYATTFPLTGNSFVVSPGLQNFLVKDTMGTTTQLPLTFAENFQANSSYTVFAYDTITAPKQITVQTNITIPSDTTARVRFANFIFSKTGVPGVDIFSVKRNANVFTNVQVTQVSDYIPFASSLSDTLMVRETGTTNLLTQLNGFNPVQKRSYTLVFRGRYQSTSGTYARLLSSFTNF